MNNNRIKVAGPADVTRTDAEAALRQIRAFTIAKNCLMNDREKKLKALDEQYGPRLKQLDEDVTALAELLRTFAENNPEEFGKRKSVEWVHGTFGFRTGTPKLVKKLKAAWNSATFLERVKNALGSLYIRTVEEVNREQIIADRATIPASSLTEAGLSVEQDEAFFAEPKLEEIENRVAA
jgi:phage host-nuclease inhibitor protein Gam